MGQALSIIKYFVGPPPEVEEIFHLLDQNQWSNHVKERLLSLYTQHGEWFHTGVIEYHRKSPLEMAIIKGSREGIEFLIEKCGADVDGSKV